MEMLPFSNFHEIWLRSTGYIYGNSIFEIELFFFFWGGGVNFRERNRSFIITSSELLQKTLAIIGQNCFVALI